MAISQAVNGKLNEQVTNEFMASQIYLSMACMFDSMSLKQLAGRFFKQTEEERGHALKILKYVLEAEGKVTLQALTQPPAEWPSVLAAIETALAHERKVTGQINDLVTLAAQEKDYATQSFLKCFVDEQVEEVASMAYLRDVAKLAGTNLLNIEMVVSHLGK